MTNDQGEPSPPPVTGSEVDVQPASKPLRISIPNLNVIGAPNPTLADLASFDPSRASLAEIGGRWFCLVEPNLGAVTLLRRTPPPDLTQERFDAVHLRFRIALGFARKAAVGLGARLAATTLIEHPFAIEKEANECIDGLTYLEVALHCTPSGDPTALLVPSDEAFVAAAHLDRLGRSFARVPPEMDPAPHAPPGPARMDEPLGEGAIMVAAILCDLSQDEGRSASELVGCVHRRFGHSIDETTIKKTCLAALRPWGVKNRRDIGYYLPPSKRPALLARIRPVLARLERRPDPPR